MATAKMGSKTGIPAKNGTNADIKDSTYGRNGVSMATPAKTQENRLIKLHERRIILGLGTSVKSAPFIPFDREIAAIAITRKAASQ